MKSLCLLLIFLLGMIFSNESQAQWQVSGLSWWQVNTFAVSDTNLFAGTSLGGVHLSANNGKSWTAVNTGLTCSCVNVLAISDTNLFAGTGGDAMNGGVFLSTNGGTNWTAVNTGLTNTDITALVISNTNIFAGTDKGIYLSTNNGESWTRAGLENADVTALVASGTNLFAGTCNPESISGGIFHSTNDGSSWTPVCAGFADVTALVSSDTNIFAGTDNGVFLSTDNGSNWVQAGLESIGVITLALSGTNLFAGTEIGGVWKRPLSEMITAVNNGKNQIPTRFRLDQNYPNPFNPSTTIGFELKDRSTVRLDVFNITGQRVQEFYLGQMSVGAHSQVVDMSRFASGIYFYRIEAIGTDERFISMKKMVLLK